MLPTEDLTAPAHTGLIMDWTWRHGHWVWMDKTPLSVVGFFVVMLLMPWEKLTHSVPSNPKHDPPEDPAPRNRTALNSFALATVGASAETQPASKESQAEEKLVSDRFFEFVASAVSGFLGKSPRIHIGLVRFAVTLWTTVIGCSLWIWIDTTWNELQGEPIKLFFYWFFPVAVVSLTFIYEGMETAYTELRDKDPQQFEGGSASRITRYIREMGQTQFFESREWAIVALLVGAALLIEQDRYFIPNLGVIDGTHPQLHDLVRITITVALTAFALVWVAQSPGKHVARHNSVEFLSYFSRATLVLLRFAWGILSLLGLQYPSEIADNLTLNRMSRCKAQRKLLPSDLIFFADGLKKYGYGFLISDEILKVSKVGEITLTSRTLHYIGDRRRKLKRKFHLEKQYAHGTKSAIENKDTHNFSCLAFEGPLIGERADESEINIWADLVYSGSPREWALKNPDYKEYPTAGFVTQVEIGASDEQNPIFEDEVTSPLPLSGQPIKNIDDQELHRLEVTLDFGEDLPRTDPGFENTKALYVLLETTVKTLPGAFALPSSGGTANYSYFRKHTHPCLRSTFLAYLPDDMPEVVFEAPYSSGNFSVTYDETAHIAEQVRFAKQKRNPPFSSEVRDAPQLPKTRGLGRSFVCFMDSSLPAAMYAVRLNTKNLQNASGEEPQSQTEYLNSSVGAAGEQGGVGAAGEQGGVGAAGEQGGVGAAGEQGGVLRLGGDSACDGI